jgi:hypothetical protein
MTLGRIAVVLGLVFSIAVALLVGMEMSAEAMAVVVGVVCGVAAGIPTSVLLLVVLSKRDRQRLEELEQQPGRRGYPPVVVIQGGASQALGPGSQPRYWPAANPPPAPKRQVNLVGGEDLLLDDGDF